MPIGIQTFSKLIEQDYVYVDKTKYFFDFVKRGGYYFISRPRRFGKSLTISTLEEIFIGNKKLFKGLWIYDKIDWSKHPVIKIDFNIITHSKGIEIFEESLRELLLEIGVKYEIKLLKTESKNMLKELTIKLSGNKKNVVLLIDEYDKPIIDYMHKMEKANENKDFLSSFYEVIKGLDEHLKFVMLTGVSKFSKVSIFSKLNNLNDITFDKKYASLFGMTEIELYDNFAIHISDTSKNMDLSICELKKNIKMWYNGYSWDGIEKVYNPFSILKFFSSERFSNFWFDTGTPSFLIENMKKRKFELSDLEKIEVEEYVFNSYDLENLDTTCLLFQTGYFTITDQKLIRDNSIKYTLKIPNLEVKNSLFNCILGAYTNKNISKLKPPYLNMIDELEEENVNNFIKLLSSSFASIPYSIYPDKENFYHSVFYLMAVLLGAKIDAEVLTDKGRIDCVIDFDDKVYVIEFKLGSSTDAIKQIKERKYYQRYLNSNKKIILLGIGGFKEKKIEYLKEEI